MMILINYDDIEIHQNDITKRNNYSNPTKTSRILPKVNTKVTYHNRDTNFWNEGLVLGKADKSTGKNKTW